jgi:hypothetical protein
MSQPEVDDQNSPTVVTFMTTEHFVLQTARSAGITETVGRAAIYLAAVSSGLIAMAFVGQLSRLGAAFYIFGLVLLPTLAFVGVTTFERALRNGVEDVQLAGRISRIRQFYFDAAPQVARYLSPPGPETPWAIARQAGVSSPFWYQFLTIAGAVAVVDSVLIGGTIGLAVQAGTGVLAASAPVGVITGAGALAGHFARQRTIWRAARQSASAPGPTAGHTP